MLSCSRNKPGIFSALMLLTIFILIFSFAFLICADTFAANPAARNLPANSGESFIPVQIDANLLAAVKYDRLSDTVHSIVKSIRGLRQYVFNTIFFLQQALFFACLSVYVFILYYKKPIKPLPIIAFSIGGHAPPFTAIIAA